MVREKKKAACMCGVTNYKSDFIKKQKAGFPMAICPTCGYHNSPNIFLKK